MNFGGTINITGVQQQLLGRGRAGVDHQGTPSAFGYTGSNMFIIPGKAEAFMTLPLTSRAMKSVNTNHNIVWCTLTVIIKFDF